MVEALAVVARTPVAALEPRVLQLAEAPAAAVRLAALRAIARMGGSRAEVALLRGLADRAPADPGARHWSCWCAGVRIGRWRPSSPCSAPLTRFAST